MDLDLVGGAAPPGKLKKNERFFTVASKTPLPIPLHYGGFLSPPPLRGGAKNEDKK